MTPQGLPHYYCLLDEQPHYLLPRHLHMPQSFEGLVVNPHAWFSWQCAPPPSVKQALESPLPFLPAECMVWVRDFPTGAAWPYWVGAESVGWLAGLRPGAALPGDLPAELVWVLASAEIAVTPDHLSRRRAAVSALRKSARGTLPRGFAALPALIPPFHLAAMRRYYRQAIRGGTMTLDDGQVARRFGVHNEPAAHFCGCQLAGLVRVLVGRAVKPSYGYLCAYQGGAELELHTDREQCEYTVSICVDATPEPAGTVPWPLGLVTAQGAIEVHQRLGDSLLFRGRTIPHYRRQLPPDHTVTTILLHYVDETYAGTAA